MNPPTDTDLAALREATRQAHEAIKDLTTATRQARAVVEEVARVAGEQVDERINVALVAGLDELQVAMKTAIENSTTAVFARFDTIADTLMGETRKDRRAGKPSLPDIVRRSGDRS